MSFTVVIHEVAARELDHELVYSAENWGKRQAARYAQMINEKVKELQRFPYKYPLCGDESMKLRMCPLKGIKLFYRVDEVQGVIIVVGIKSIYQQVDYTQLNKRN